MEVGLGQKEGHQLAVPVRLQPAQPAGRPPYRFADTLHHFKLRFELRYEHA
jgi:hypothetical protein